MDAAAFTRLGDVFAGVMRGNLTLLGLAIANKSATLAGHITVALGGYAEGVALGTLLGRGAGRGTGGHQRRVTIVFLAELVVLAAFTLGWVLTDSRPTSAVQLILLAHAALAMGVQDVAVRFMGAKTSTTYLTGTLTTVIANLTVGAHSGEGRSVAALAAHAAGAAVAGALLLAVPAALAAVPDAAIVLVVTVLVTRGAVRGLRATVSGDAEDRGEATAPGS
jgi:uncharacterized membrane protein YoaK (UPF0700 family)